MKEERSILVPQGQGYESADLRPCALTGDGPVLYEKDKPLSVKTVYDRKGRATKLPSAENPVDNGSFTDSVPDIQHTVPQTLNIPVTYQQHTSNNR